MRIAIKKSVENRMQKYVETKHPDLLRIGFKYPDAIDQLLKDVGF